MREDNVFICGYRPRRRMTEEELDARERKVLKNFGEFLRGVGDRCPDCLHKATKHTMNCRAKDCTCTLTDNEVHDVRRSIGAK